MKSLLQKSIRPFIAYALLILLASIPVYYFMVDSIWLNELDEHNKIVATRTQAEFNKLSLQNSNLDTAIQLWNKIQPTTPIVPSTAGSIHADTTFTINRQNEFIHEEIDRFRVLKTPITLNNKTYILTVETNVEETEETVIAIALVTLIFYIILVIGFLWLNKRQSKKLWLPFRKTLSQLQSFNLSQETNLQFSATNTQEFVELNTALQKLIDNNITVFKTQKEFTENASHELQTPLAIIKNKLDVLLQKESLTDRQYQLIEDINKSLTRIARINKNLLLLAKIDNHQFEALESINLSTALQKNIETVTDFIDNKQLQLHTAIASNIQIMGNSTLVELLFTNLLMNAIRHTPHHGSIHINLNLQAITISNSGSIALNKDKLFKRFTTTSSETVGSGLGLATIQQICHVHQWKAAYHFQDNLHHFVITFR